MGQHYLLQASVFRATVLFAVLVSIPRGHSDCAVCQYKINTTTSDITMFVGDSSSCSVQNTSITSAQNSITVTGLQPGNTYFFKINCSDVCCGNFSTNSSSNLTITQLKSLVYLNWTGQLSLTNQSFTLRPEPVSNLSVHSITVSSMNLSWILPDGISPYYRVAWGVNLLLTTNQTSMQISQLTPGIKYSFSVTSVASDNRTEGHAAEISQNTSPAQVENITVLNSSNSSLTLDWAVPLGHVDSYMVNVSGAELNTSLVQTHPTNSSVISNLMAGRVYNITVTTISGVLKNSSNIVLAATKPNPPEAVRVSGQTNVSITLLWLKPLSMDGVTVSYEVSYRSNQSGVNQLLNNTNSLNMTLTNVLPSSQYDITVVTIGVKDLRSSYVNLTAYAAPNAVQNLAVSAVSTNSVNLTWLPPNGTLSLFSYSVNITSPDQTLSTTSNNYQITQLQPGTQYNCSVRALIIAANIFGPSQIIQCNTKPLPVTNLTASPVGTTEMRLSWSRQNDYKSSYQYNVSVNGEQWIQSINETINVVNLIPGNNYTFTVQTVENGMSSESVAISAFTGLGKASNMSAVGTTQSMRVEWRPPDGIVSLYNVKILLNGTVLRMENRTNETTVVFSDLLPGTQYNVIVTSISGPIKQDSDSVSNATLPTPTGEFVTVQSTNSLNISWARPLNMSSVSHYFQLSYSNSMLNCSQNYSSLTGLNAGVQYNITVRTVGAMGYFSSPQYLTAYTNPTAVTDVRLNGYTETSITLSWLQHDVQQSGYSYLLTFTHPNGTVDQKTVNNARAQLLSLQSASQYNISIITQTAGGTKSYPQFITAYSKPFPVSSVKYDVLNVSAVKLSWSRPPEYHNGFSYQVLVSNCTENSRNLSTFSENIIVPDLQPGTLCQFSLYSLAFGILGEPVNFSVFTKPSTVIPQLDNQGSNHSLLVTWDHPVGGLDMYILNISSEGWSSSKVLNSTEHNHTFSQLKAATVFTVTLTIVKAAFWETSHSVNMATYPNRPGEIKILLKSNHSVWFQWDEAENMSAGSFNYSLTCWLSYNTSQYLTPNNTFLLDGLRSGTSYNVSVATVGPMGFQSESIRVHVTTKPDPVQNLQLGSVTTNNISVIWAKVEGVPKYVIRVYSEKVENKLTSTNNSMTIYNLMPSTLYNISVQSSTSDNTEGEAVCLQACTDAAPVESVTCTGPDLTFPMLTLSWSPPPGNNQGFEVKLNSSNSEKTFNLNHTFTGLRFNTLYKVMLWTIGCGKKSTVESITCMTGITKPVVPKITAVSVSELQYNKFTLNLPSDVFNDSNGPVLYYGVLVYSGTIDCLDKNNKLDRCLLNTYEDWKAKLCSTFMAVVKDTGSTSVQIGDETMWKGYKNGELNAKVSYNFAVIAFTRLETNNSLVDVSNSYYSMSEFYQSPITLPENPVVIGGAAAGVGFAALLVVIIIVVVVCRRKQRKDESTSVPIHSIRNKVSDPIKVEDYEAYYKRQRADSFCGFAEEFEDLRPVGINQPKTVAQAPENKAKNRYNNVLPYDSSRVKLSVLSSPFDDYINASYMPGYTSKKEFIAAQGPLPCTVDDFWRLIWEKNIHTIVMLTKCNEQGRVKCEEYWPAETKHFHNLTVTNTSEITLEDWTLHDFEVKNVKTAESRSVRHFHFTAWPDHGVPETTELLINFRHLVREHMDQYSRHSPTLVHCSAGVGRTGTFIAIDRLIFQIERDGVVDVYGIIHDLRMHRPLMVQTEDQYVFLNQCSMDIIKSRTGNNVDLIYQNTAALTIYENFEPLKKAKNGYHKA
ncbi:receptor-type tyrosine-protein phosphatase eta-like [Sinocyclocheilus grahami]|uniref:receptor-type tyrosine-protein phosphatase eta-like n=1 Tax=Sinocyclocheilus grahami TaxID=75366 RepID=UPI0007AD0FF9|nr:PREDICTED: receptor-type tyrosine-protein phosphatase eta-like [Sinocyclocheilus grahami]